MLLITDLHQIPPSNQPCGLTIGSFDGVHLGHQALLKHLKFTLHPNSQCIVFTFSNHPSHLFTPDRPIPLISPPVQKVKLLFEHGADVVILIPFNADFAQTPFSDFLKFLKKKLQFSRLVLGIGATFGKGKEGDEIAVRKLSEKLEFSVEYLPKTMIDGEPVSSGRIRSLIAKGAFNDVQKRLGRDYSLMGRYQGSEFFHLPLQGICLPPEGIYPVRVKRKSSLDLARAYVLPLEQKIRLDLFQETIPLHDEDIEIIF